MICLVGGGVASAAACDGHFERERYVFGADSNGDV